MKHPWFNLRMLIVGVILLVPYIPALWLATEIGLPLIYGICGLLLCLGVQYWVGIRRALRSVNAVELPADSEPVQRTHELAADLDVAPPKLSVGAFGSPNAFAVGRRGRGHIVVSRSLIEILDEEELDAVLVHELSHLRSRDTIPMLLGQGSAGIVFAFATLLESIIPRAPDRPPRRVNTPLSDVSHSLVMCLVFVISRQREYIADADAADVLGTPTPMQSALATLETAYTEYEFSEPPEAVETLCIASDWSLAQAFSSHPPLSDRINVLGSRASAVDSESV